MPVSFPTPLQLLIIEDNPVDVRILMDLLRKAPFGSFECTHVTSLKQAVFRLERGRFDVCLLDLNLEDSFGLTTLQDLHERFSTLPIVVISGAYTEAMGLKVLNAGAQDYVLKGNYTAYTLTKSLYYALERKKGEDALQAAYRELKEAQSRLIEAEKSQIIGTIATGVAHEVKNPLATIIYGVEYLQTAMPEKSEKLVHTLHCMRESAFKANDIIMGLLDFGSVAVLNFCETNINTVVERSLHLIQPQCDQARVRVNRHLADNLPNVRIDAGRIEQVFMNLYLNALHAMPDGGELTVETRWYQMTSGEKTRYRKSGAYLPKDGPLVVVDISDTGPGISPDDAERLFDPFFTTRRASGGIGLGLSISRMIVRNHNGFILVENRDGRGARARVGFTT